MSVMCALEVANRERRGHAWSVKFEQFMTVQIKGLRFSPKDRKVADHSR